MCDAQQTLSMKRIVRLKVACQVCERDEWAENQVGRLAVLDLINSGWQIVRHRKGPATVICPECVKKAALSIERIAAQAAWKEAQRVHRDRMAALNGSAQDAATEVTEVTEDT